MNDQIRVGVIGTSWWTDTMHLAALQSHARAKIAAICGRNRDWAAEMAQKYDIRHVFTDYRSLLEHADLQAVVVAVPDDLHYPMTMDALDAGLHVLCEKPLAPNADRARKMFEKAEAAGVKHMAFFTWRWLPSNRYVQHLIGEGYIGTPYDVNIRFLAGYGRNAVYNWRFDRDRANGILGDLGSHMIDLARWHLGDIVRVNAHLSTFVKRPGSGDRSLDAANDCALLTLQFGNGAVGVIHVSAIAHVADRVTDQHTILSGKEGALETVFDFARGYGVRGASSDEDAYQTLTIPDELLAGVDVNASVMDQWLQVLRTQSVGTRHFVDAIIQDQPVSPTFYDGLKAQEVIDAAIRSDEQGCWVSLP